MSDWNTVIRADSWTSARWAECSCGWRTEDLATSTEAANRAWLHARSHQLTAEKDRDDLCNVFWGSHGCDMPPGHTGPHVCEPADDGGCCSECWEIPPGPNNDSVVTVVAFDSNHDHLSIWSSSWGRDSLNGDD